MHCFLFYKPTSSIGLISVNKPITRSLTSLCKMLDQQDSATVTTRRPSPTPPLPRSLTQQPSSRQCRARQCLVPAPLPPPCCDSSNSLSLSPIPLTSLLPSFPPPLTPFSAHNCLRLSLTDLPQKLIVFNLFSHFFFKHQKEKI